MEIKDTIETMLKLAPIYSTLTLATLSNFYLWDRCAGNPYYHFAGVLSAEIAHSIDDLTSQAVINQYEIQPNNEVSDSNPLLGNGLNYKNYMRSRAVAAPFVGFMGFVSPPTGLAYLAISPYLAYNNLKIAKKLKNQNAKPIVKKGLKRFLAYIKS